MSLLHPGLAKHMNNIDFYNQINQQANNEIPLDLTLHDAVSATCIRYPDRIATECGNQQLWFAELDQKSNQLANYLAKNGVKRGDFVALCCNREIDMMILMVGILKSGACYVPIDPEYPIDRVRYMIEDSGASFIVTHESHQTLVSSFGVPFAAVDDKSTKSEISECANTNPNVSMNAQKDPAYVIYTSGSTGKPKGVLVHHSGVVNLCRVFADKMKIGPNDKSLSTATLCFDLSILETFVPLVAGSTVCVVDRKTAKDNELLVKAIEHHDITLMQSTPAMWRLILETDFKGHDKMKFASGGEALPKDLVNPLLDRCGELWNMYGPTEITVTNAIHQIQRDDERIFVGYPFPNTSLYIVDENDNLLPPESAGELLIGGRGVTLGYKNRDELTDEKFVEFNGERVYRSGDLCVVSNEGLIEPLGRIDDQIKLDGHRIELEEIDATIAQHAQVNRAATVLREDIPGHKRLVAYLLSNNGEAIDIGDVLREISAKMPEYMVPSAFSIVDAFPYTPSGKLDRKAFPAPSNSRPEIGTEFVSPKTAEEKQLAEIFAEFLQLDRVGTGDNFFELGGKSLLALKAINKANTELDLDIAVAEFFDHPTVTSLLKLSAQKKTSIVASQKSSEIQNRNIDDQYAGQFAIVGMAAKLPGAKNIDEFWQNLVEGKESIQFFSKEELDDSLDPNLVNDPNYVAARGILGDATKFDARFFGMSPKQAELTDPQHRLLLEVCWTALEDAGCIPNNDQRIGIWGGTYSTTYYEKNLLSHPDLIREQGEFQMGINYHKDFITTRVAHKLNLKGPAINVNTACSTSLVALAEACKSLEVNHCDVALAGGSSVNFPIKSGHLHQTGSIFTPDGHCRPFDANSGGTLFCDGAGVVVVKRLADAIENNDRIYAVVKGIGINNDGGEKASFGAPSIDGQAQAVAMAQADANVSPETISYIEAHGTATPIGDPIEVTALTNVFRRETTKRQFCAIGSVKSNIGHTVAAAGVAGLIKTALALHHEKLPATLHFKNPNPQIDFEQSPFYVADRLIDWSRDENSPRRAGISSFGVGGTNAHVIIEESPRQVERSQQSPAAFSLPVSAKTESALNDSIDNLVNHLKSNKSDSSTISIKDLAYTLQNGRKDFAYKAAIRAESIDEAIEIFESKKKPRFLNSKSNPGEREVVFMFPGQGAQYVGMGQDLYQHSAVFREHFDRCCELLTPLIHKDLREVLLPDLVVGEEQNDAQEILSNTQYTQPALFALGYSLCKLWKSWGIEPASYIGHSIGEFAAACSAGVFKLEDGLAMIAQRGAMMQALPSGSMMSVRLNGKEVEPMLYGDLAIASYNGPKLCVVAGPDDQVQQLQAVLESKEIACRYLYTSHAFHSSMMDSIVEPFAEFIGQFDLQAPDTPILSTVTADWMTDEQATDPKYWAKHLRAPVNFSGAVGKMWQEDSSRILIELGPRKTLATLAKQHASDPKSQIALPTLSDNPHLNAEWNATYDAINQLWLAGVKVDWKKVQSGGKHISLPTYPFERKDYFIAPNQNVQSKQADAPQQSESTLISNSLAPQPAVVSDQNQTTSSSNQTLKEPTLQSSPMSRKSNIIDAINEVFETSSGYDLTEFETDTTFFEMGFDSLVLTQTATALKKEFATEITFRQLLEETTNVELLAEFLDETLPADRYAASAASEPTVETPNAEPSGETAQAVEASQPVVAPELPAPSAQPQPNQAPQALAMQIAQPVQAIPQQALQSFQPNQQPAATNAAQAIVQNQLQLMAAQLQFLGGQPTAPITVAPPVATEIAHPAVESGNNSVTPTANAQPPSIATTAASPEPQNKANSNSESKSESKSEDKPKKPFGAAARVSLDDDSLTAEQREAMDRIVEQQTQMQAGSKDYAQQHRQYFADPRTVSGFTPTLKEMTHPVVIKKSKGVHMWDVDGNQYIDFLCGFGSNFLGHSRDFIVDAITEQANRDFSIGPQSDIAGKAAKLFCELTGNERVAFANTGSEAILGATRLARTFSGRKTVVMFNGDYHGILDEVIVRGNKKQKSFPAATGIPNEHVSNTLILDYGSDEALEIIKNNLQDIAAICVEPVQSRRPELQPTEFLQKISAMTENDDCALIFDEVITGLRIGTDGAQGHFGVKADLGTYGKVVGGGMPIGVIAGKAKYMDGLDGGFWQYGDDSRPEAGMTYFAGTFVRHPIALATSLAIMTHIKEQGPSLYTNLNSLAEYMAKQLNDLFKELDAPMTVANFGSLFKVHYTSNQTYSELLYSALRRRGMHVYDHRPMFLNTSHKQQHVDQLVAAFKDSIIEMQRFGFLSGDGYKRVKPTFNPEVPPQPNARIGKDQEDNPGWFVEDAKNPGQYVQLS